MSFDKFIQAPVKEINSLSVLIASERWGQKLVAMMQQIKKAVIFVLYFYLQVLLNNVYTLPFFKSYRGLKSLEILLHLELS